LDNIFRNHTVVSFNILCNSSITEIAPVLHTQNNSLTIDLWEEEEEEEEEEEDFDDHYRQ
jgi:hypothetical protein